MTLWTRWLSVIMEAGRMARAQPTASILSILIVAGMCGTVVMTSGKTEGAETKVISSIDSAGSRTVLIKADPEAKLSSTVLQRIKHIGGIEWAGAFGLAVDAQNAAIQGGVNVPIRSAWLPPGFLSEPSSANKSDIWISAEAQRDLGMRFAQGYVVDTNGVDHSVAGVVNGPSFLKSLEPLALSPRSIGDPGDISELVVVASRANLVNAVSQSVQSVLDVKDPTKITISTSQSLVNLHALVKFQLSSASYALVISVLAVGAVLVALVSYGFVMLRRKDFGRRRALGATRSLIFGMVVVQSLLLSIIGALIGEAVSAEVLDIQLQPLPSLSFFVALAVVAVAVGIVSASVPALVAARRDPLVELRLP